MQGPWAAQSSLLPKGIWLPRKEEISLRNRQPRCCFAEFEISFLCLSHPRLEITPVTLTTCSGEKWQQPVQMKGNFLHKNNLSQKAPFRETDKHTYLQSKAKHLQSPGRFVQQHVYNSPPPLPCPSAGEDNSCNLCNLICARESSTNSWESSVTGEAGQAADCCFSTEVHTALHVLSLLWILPVILKLKIVRNKKYFSKIGH